MDTFQDSISTSDLVKTQVICYLSEYVEAYATLCYTCRETLGSEGGSS